MGYLTEGVRVVVLHNEDVSGRMCELESHDEVDSPRQAPPVYHLLGVGFHVDLIIGPRGGRVFLRVGQRWPSIQSFSNTDFRVCMFLN